MTCLAVACVAVRLRFVVCMFGVCGSEAAYCSGTGSGGGRRGGWKGGEEDEGGMSLGGKSLK